MKIVYLNVLYHILTAIVLLNEVAPGTRSAKTPAKDSKHVTPSSSHLGATNDHSYNKVSKNNKSDPTLDQSNGNQEWTPVINVECNGCEKSSVKTIGCGFCENSYCVKCSGLDRHTFEALAMVSSVSWYCVQCIKAVPGVSKVLVRLGNI